MTTYSQQYGHLHGSVLPAPKPKPPKPRPQATPLRQARPVTHTTRGQGPAPTPADKVPSPPPPPGSLGIPDLPPDIEAIVAQILANDPENGAARALAYIRGTDWYKVAYAGIGAGIKSGVISGEADYRSWKGQVADVFKRYYGRDATPEELVSFLAQGFTPGTVEQIGGGHAWAAANKADTEYLAGAFGEGRLTDAELQTLGEQQVGRQSVAGAGFQTKLDQAARKMQRIFEGTLASPSFQLGGAGLSAPSLQTKQKPDVAA
jgi:hypothetical protein